MGALARVAGAVALLLGLAACEGGNYYEPPAYSLGKCFWQPYLPNC